MFYTHTIAHKFVRFIYPLPHNFVRPKLQFSNNLKALNVAFQNQNIWISVRAFIFENNLIHFLNALKNQEM